MQVTLIAFLGALSAAASGSYHADGVVSVSPQHSCPLEVAASDLVVRATLMVVVDQKEGQMLALDMRPIEVLKGSATEAIRATAHLALVNESADDIRALRGKEIVAFLIQNDDPFVAGLYLTPKAGKGACEAIGRTAVDIATGIRQEVRWQDAVTARKPPDGRGTVPHGQRVRAIIGRLLRKATQSAAVERARKISPSSLSRSATLALREVPRP